MVCAAPRVRKSRNGGHRGGSGHRCDPRAERGVARPGARTRNGRLPRRAGTDLLSRCSPASPAVRGAADLRERGGRGRHHRRTVGEHGYRARRRTEFELRSRSVDHDRSVGSYERCASRRREGHRRWGSERGHHARCPRPRSHRPGRDLTARRVRVGHPRWGRLLHPQPRIDARPPRGSGVGPALRRGRAVVRQQYRPRRRPVVGGSGVRATVRRGHLGHPEHASRGPDVGAPECGGSRRARHILPRRTRGAAAHDDGCGARLHRPDAG